MKIPDTTSLTILNDIPLEDVIKLIDWKMYLVTWDFRTAATRESAEAEELLADSRKLLERVVNEKMLSVEGAVRILPAVTVDFDNIVLYTDENRDEVLRTLPMLRRQIPRMGLCPSLADFITPSGSETSTPGIDDYMGFFAVTAGKKVDESLKLFPEHDLYSPLLLKSLADRLAEAGAEYLHRKVRRELWGYTKDEDLTSEEILREKYQGIRPAPGYPCCPDHTGKRDIFDILEAEKSIEIFLTESYMMQPAASVCGYIFASEKSHYFPVGKIGDDQLKSYAQRKGYTVEDIKHWLAVNVND
jgi:5-methyltetrahydrofolate--homocysteine methyltransferase